MAEKGFLRQNRVLLSVLIVFRLMPFKAWGVAGGLLLIATILPLGPLHATQEPVVRVLVFEANQLRFRADGNQPLLVLGMLWYSLRDRFK